MARRVPLLNLQALHAPFRDEILAEMARVFDSQAFILGEDVSRLERSIATYCHAPFAIGCASGTDALILALAAAGVGRGDQVITSPFTFFSTASAIHLLGAKPVFADIDPATFNLCPMALEEAAERCGGPVKAVIPVHLFGGSSDMDPILGSAARHGWRVIEDGAQAVGAEYCGRRVLGLGTFGCLSFFPSKNLGGLGDGGMVTTSGPEDAQLLRMLRVHGSAQKYFHTHVGYNSRLDTLQAAVLNVKLRFLDAETAGRQRNAARYGELLAGLPVRPPVPAAYQTRHVFNQYVIRCARRDELKAHLGREGVGAEIYYPLPLHLQECFRYLGYGPGDFPESEKAAGEVLALPIHSALADEDLAYVAGAIARFF